MSRSIAALYTRPPGEIRTHLRQAIDLGLSRSSGKVKVFFRADDIGYPSGQFNQMIGLFQHHRVPLCLATVPTWLTHDNTNRLRECVEVGASQWYWHHHGFLHRNNETTGKKQEFGPCVDSATARRWLAQGWGRLEQFLAEDVNKVFTPPWNRCSKDTLEALIDCGYLALSRSQGAEPKAPAQLPDLQIQVDLHTRKEADSELCLAGLCQQLSAGLSSGCCGIMLHHQRMNRAAGDFLDLLLALLRQESQCELVHFGHLLATDKSTAPI